ncbi:MAG TPA: response regulator [Thermoanaerobaculia bacterium]|nr:response regulator [Thermoanaerobaculia bacterium]
MQQESAPVIPRKIEASNAAPGETVLVVDDDEALRGALRDALSEEGFRVGCVENGRQAIDVLKAGARPSVILLDLHTPEMDGLEFRRRQATDPAIAGIPVIVLTADLEKESEARQLGVSFYLKKPVPFPQLVEVVAHFAGRPAEGGVSRGYEPAGSEKKG